MKIKHVHLVNDLATAAKAVATARAAGAQEDDIALIARSDVEMERIPDDFRTSNTDFAPAALKGLFGGGAAGLVAGLVAMAIPGLGVTLAGAAAITAVGAATGTWSSSLIGASLPDPVRQRFEDEIESGRILVVVDASEDDQPRIDAALEKIGATPLPFEESTALS